MKLVVYSHKECGKLESCYGTDGGFPFQMRALSELFHSTMIAIPFNKNRHSLNDTTISGNNIKIFPLTALHGKGIMRKAILPIWIIINARKLISAAIQADVIHAPIPGDVGTIGIFLALILRKPLFIRHCGNWNNQRTVAERLWRYIMEKYAGGKNLMLATGASLSPPSLNSNIKWIFSTSISKSQIQQHRSAHKQRLITVCRIEKYKGLDILIDSLPLLLNDYPELQLTIIGDGSYLAELKQRAANLKIEDKINFCGYLSHSDVISELRNNDLFCYPTLSDGFPKAVIEAMACGLPVIASDISPVGIRIPNITPFKLAEQIQQCFSSNVVYEEMSKDAVNQAREYTLEKWQDEIKHYLFA